MLEVINISKSYGENLVFKNISFSVKKGEVISILGKSGIGKSTLLKCLNRSENIDEGEIILNKQNISTMTNAELRQKIGIVFQEYNLFDHLTVIENLTIGLMKIKKLSLEQSTKLSMKALKKVGLLNKANSFPDELSGGQQQRVAIARTLVMKPSIILLDEPTSALDKKMKDEVINLILKLANDNMTLLVVSHEEDLVKKISDKIIYIKNGKGKIETNNEKSLK